KLDPTIDFSQYVDPATGFVPLVLFMHEAMGGGCGPSSAPQNHWWAHRFALPADTTQDDWPGHPGQKVKISDYILQPGVGGANSCTTSQIMPIGTVAHETGHGFGLPDLYDTDGPTEGIGQWGLMSSGSFTSPLSPALMQADGFGNLDANAAGNSCPSGSIFAGCSDRGDAGDLYPGTTGNTAFIFRTNPASLKNADGSFTGVAIDSVQQLVTDRTMS